MKKRCDFSKQEVLCIQRQTFTDISDLITYALCMLFFENDIVVRFGTPAFECTDIVSKPSFQVSQRVCIHVRGYLPTGEAISEVLR